MSRITDVDPVLESLLSNSVTGMVIVDGSGTVTRSAPGVSAFIGTEPLPPIGRRIADLLPEVGALLVFIALLLPLGLAGFSLAVRKAREEGSLAQY